MADEDGFLSDDGSFTDRKKQNKVVLNQMVELWKDNEDFNRSEYVTNGVQQLANDFMEELDEEYEQEYKAANVPEQICIDLIHMNSLQKAYQYRDKYPMLRVRKQILILVKTISYTALKISKHQLFEALTLVVIIINSILLSIQYDDQEAIELTFLILYYIEALIKIIGKGLIFNSGAYLRDIWNVIDALVIVAGSLQYFMSTSVQLSALRSLRVLRPIKAISSIKSLKQIMTTFFLSFNELANALLVLGFTQVIFAIIGLQLFQGYTKYRCFDEIGIQSMKIDQQYCHNCLDGYICGKMLENQKKGYLSFDNFGLALLQVFIISNLEGWVDIMAAIIYTFSEVAVLYFITFIIISAYFLIHLTLAILKVNFKKSNHIEDNQVEEVSYNYRQLKRLNIYKPINDNKRKQNFHRQQSMRRSRIIRSIQPKQPTFIENSVNQAAQVKLPFKPLLINEYSKPKKLKHHNTMITLHGIYGVKNDESKQKNNDSNNHLYRRATQRNILKRGTSILESNPLQELEQMLQGEKERIPRQTLAQQKLIKDVKLIASSFQRTPALITTVKQALRKSRIEQEIKQQDNSLSVSLTEIESVADEKVKERFQELDILYQEDKEEKVGGEPKKQIQTTSKKQKKAEQFKPQPLEISKEDEKLKIRLFETKLYPRVLYKEHICESIKDVLPSLERETQLLELKKREEKRRNMKVSLRYQLQIQFIEKKFEKKDRKLTYDSSKESSNKNIKIFPDSVKQQSKFARQADFIARSPSSFNGSNRQKMIGKSYFKPYNQSQKYSYKQYKEFFNIDLTDQQLRNRIEEVEIKEPDIRIPKEEYFHHHKFYQQFHNQKIQDIENLNGELITEASILEVKAVDFDPFMMNKYEKIIQALNYTQDNFYIYMKGIVGLYKLVRFRMNIILGTNAFEYIINLFVLANTVVLGLDGLVSNKSELEKLNLFFTILFTIEQVLKIFTYGVSKYSKDIMNIFDLCIVLLSLIDLLFLSSGSGSHLQAFRSLRLFRAFRIFRVTKLVRSLAYTNFLIQILSNAFYSLMYITFLLFLFIYIFTLLGMSFFQGALTNTQYRTSFDTFLDSLLVVSQILILQWIDVLYELLLSDVNNSLVISYLLIWIFIGNYVLLNLLMASLLNYFEDEYQQENIQQQRPSITVTMVDKVIEDSPENPIFQKDKTQFSNSSSNDMRMSTMKNAFTYNFDFRQCKLSLMLFDEQNAFRIVCQRIINHKVFNLVIFFVICFSTIKLILDTYFDNFLIEFDIFITCVFLIEFLLKVIAQGFITEPNTYMRNTWNVLDFTIIIISIIDIPYTDQNLSYFKVLRLLRTLRPLRLVKENKQLKLLVTTLLNSLSGVLNVTIIIVLVFIMFGILGVSLLQDKMHYCDITSQNEFNYYDQQECKELGGEWSNRNMNFDNILNSILTLFILSRRDDWDKQIYWYIDASDDGPEKNAQLWIIIYFLTFIYTGSILLMDLFTGVIFVNYKFADFSMKDKVISADQEDWINIQKMIVASSPNFALYYPPLNFYRALIFNLISNRYFDGTIIFLIIFNVVVLSLNYDESSSNYNSILENLNLCFNFIFIGECILKIIAYGPRGYFRNSWNQFDFFVVLTSALDITLKLSGASNQNSFLSSGPQLFRVFRVLRVTKLFRLVKQLKGLKKLIDTATFALPELFELILLMLLMYCIFAILAAFLYSDVTDGSIIDDTYNFKNFHHALLTLFRCTTGEGQYQIIYDIMESHGAVHCLFFVVFSIAIQRIMLNLFILIVIQQYERFYINSDNPLQRFKEFEQDFIDGWAPLSKQYGGSYIKVKQLISLVLTIKSPLGYDLNEKILLALDDWKKFNQEVKQTQQNIDRIINIVTADCKKKVATTIMTMEMTATDDGQLEYHYVFFTIMKMFQQQFMQKTTKEAKTKIKQHEEQTLQRIRKNRIYINGVNPCVQLLYVMMCFKAFKRFSEKAQDKALQKPQEFSEQSSDSYYCYSSSEIAQREPQSIMSNTSRESQNQFCTPPDLTVYQSDININSNKTSLIQIFNRQQVSLSQTSEINSPYIESAK
ncbi:unnamed protein product [Paramecium octaurelia]|uniref:Ion transport domain-containing protein n=1 Tax=Paramecium octaurelia TaxID=43137 RepID=A0A8S1VZ77_PAROT|nr:unnamed protein product [Paramecium octaurelia]